MREKLKSLLLSFESKYNSFVFDRGRLADYLIANDVTVQQHGRWVEWWPEISLIMTGEEMLYRCSCCDAKYPDVEAYKFCPHCGAMMDQEAEHEN